MALLPSDEQRAVSLRRDYYSEFVERLLLDGRKASMFAFDDVRITRLGILGMCSWTYQWYRPGGELGTDEVAMRLWRLVMDGIGVPKATVPTTKRRRK